MRNPLKRRRPSGEQGGAERRRNVRHATVFQIARLRTAALDELCILRDISVEGLRAEVYCPVQPDEAITIELRTGHSVSGKVAWAENQHIGVAFDAPAPISTLLTHCSFDDRLDKIRPLRIAVDIPAVLRAGGIEMSVRVRNVSQGGLGISAGEPLQPEERCDIRIPEFDRRGVIVRWWRDGECGLELMQPLTYTEFVTWRQRLSQSPDDADTEPDADGYKVFS